MRENKFRAWDIENKKMTYGVDLCYDNKGNLYRLRHDDFQGDGEIDPNWNGDVDIDKFHLMQFTGLPDKKDKEIYDKDVIRIYDIYGPHIGSIEWWGDRWTVTYKGKIDNTKQHQSLMTVKNCEIIGNIYENPELLKDSSNAKT